MCIQMYTYMPFDYIYTRINTYMLIFSALQLENILLFKKYVFWALGAVYREEKGQPEYLHNFLK